MAFLKEEHMGTEYFQDRPLDPESAHERSAAHLARPPVMVDKVGACVDCGAPVINGESLSGPLDPDGVVHTCRVEMTDTDWAWLNTVEG